MNEQEKAEFEKIANAATVATAEQVFVHMITQYVGKTSAMKLIAPAEQIEHAVTMGEWMLVELAMATFGVTFPEAATIVRRNLRAARNNMGIVNATDSQIM